MLITPASNGRSVNHSHTLYIIIYSISEIGQPYCLCLRLIRDSHNQNNATDIYKEFPQKNYQKSYGILAMCNNYDSCASLSNQLFYVPIKDRREFPSKIRKRLRS